MFCVTMREGAAHLCQLVLDVMVGLWHGVVVGGFPNSRQCTKKISKQAAARVTAQKTTTARGIKYRW